MALLRIVLLFLVACSFGYLFAEDTASTYVAKSKSLADRSYHTEFEGDLLIVEGGQELVAKVKGQLTYKTLQKARSKSNMTLSVNNQNLVVGVLVVHDGKHSWEVTSLAGSPTAVIKKKVENESDWDQGSMDLGNWYLNLEQAGKLANLEIIDKDGHLVTLEASISTEDATQMGAFIPPQLDSNNLVYRVILDTKLMFPKSVFVGTAEKSLQQFNFSNVRFIDTNELPDELFEYTPPEDALVKEI